MSLNLCLQHLRGHRIKPINRASIDNVKVTDLAFADGAVIHVESFEVLEMKPLGLRLKEQLTRGLLDKAVQSV